MRSPARAVASILWRSAASGTEIAALAKPPLGKSLTGLPVLPIRRRRHLLLRNPRLSLLLQQKTRRENPINRKLPAGPLCVWLDTLLPLHASAPESSVCPGPAYFFHWICFTPPVALSAGILFGLS